MLAVGADALSFAMYSSPGSAFGDDDFLPNDHDGHFQAPRSVCCAGSPVIAADAYSHALRGRSHTPPTR